MERPLARCKEGCAKRSTHIVPCTGTKAVGTLIACVLVNEHTAIAMVVCRAGASIRIATRRGGWAVGLETVLEVTGLFKARDKGRQQTVSV